MMHAPLRLVFDTNIVVSSIAFPGSTPDRALVAAQSSIMLSSQATLAELIEVIERPVWDRYIGHQLRTRLAPEYMTSCEVISVISSIHACRDPKDDKFLELAIDGQADFIVTGDKDLLALHPFHDIAILTPAQFLER
jgi:putative PIN family toxin of toxin-antitoxin system